MKKPVSSTNRKFGFTRVISLAAIVLIAAVFITALPNIGARAESVSSFFGVADIFGWNEAVVGKKSTALDDFAPQANTPSAVNYAFVTTTTGTLTDMSSGTATLVAADQDDTSSSVTNIGFDFYYMGVRYSQFSANSNGLMRLGSTLVQGSSPYKPLAQASIPLITPYGADQRTHIGDGKVHSKVIGSAPNRVLVVEWLNMQSNFNSGGTADLTYQARLSESSGVIEFAYGSMTMSTAGTADPNSKDPNIGFSTNSTATTIGTITAPQSGTPAPSYNGNTATAVANTYTAGAITTLTSAANGSRRTFTLTSPTPTAPTSLTFTSVALSSMTLNWADAPNEVGYAIYRSTDNVNFTFAGTAASDATTFAATGLNPSTNYFWQVYSLSEGALSSALTGNQATTAPSFCGTVTVGPTGTYPTVAAALGAIGTQGLNCASFIELQAAYVSSVETFPIVVSTIGGASVSNTLTIRPQSGASNLSITGSNTTAVIDMNGANYVIFDGRIGSTGTTKNLTIANTSTATGGTAVLFRNEASNNAVRYSTLRSAYASATSGVVIFSTTTGANGNDNNSIDNNDIDGGAGATASPTTGVAQNGIYATGTTTSTATNNSGNTIANNNIFNNFVTGATATTSGILVSSGNTDWTISGNSFYQTAARTSTVGAATVIGVNLTAGNNHSVTANFIGGSAASAGGSAYTIAGAFANRFRGISLSVGTTTASSVQGNTIANINVSSTSGATTAPGIFSGIYLTAGNANIGNVTGNVIGSGTGTGSITSTISNTGGISFGIVSDATSTVSNISNNTIGSINAAGSTTSVSHSFVGIQATSVTTLTVSGNTVGSTSTPNSINAITATTSTTAQKVSGIENSGSGTVNITNNTIANLNNASNSTGTTTFLNQTRGIASSSGINTITGNAIRNLSTATPYTGTLSSASVIGISMTSTTTGNAAVSQNTIHSLANTNTTAAISVIGLYYAGPTTGTNIVARNFVHSLSIVSTSTTADLTGIRFNSGLATFQNNMVRLGIDAAGNPLTTGIPITGLYEFLSTGNSAIYHNSVFIGGTGVGTQTGSTYAFRSDQVSNVRIFRDNIFVNSRSNATTGGKHYAVRVAGTTANPGGLTINNNIYLANGTGGVFGFFNSADVLSLMAWRTAVGQDAASFNSDPQYLTPNGTAATVDLHINPSVATDAEGNGFDAGVTDDFDGQTRASFTPVDIGADAGNFTSAGDTIAPIVSYTTLANTDSTTDRTLGITVTDNVGVTAVRIYFRKVPGGTGTPTAYFSNTCSSTGGTALNGTYNCLISNSALGGVAATDVVQYFVAARDAANNISSNPTGTIGTDFANLNFAGTPNSYTILGQINGTKTVGAGGDYNTLTDAVAALNNNVVNGAVTLSLTDTSYPTETFPLTINANSGSSAINTITIKPAISVTSAISGSSSGCIIKINGADYVTLDGSNAVGGTTRDLTVTNTSTADSTAAVCVSSNVSDGAQNNTVKNLNVSTGVDQSTSTNFSFGIISSSSAAILTGATDNDNNTYDNNFVQKANFGIASFGALGTNPNQTTKIRNNLIGPASFGTNEIGTAGVLIFNENNIEITQNEVRFVGDATTSNAGAGRDRVGIVIGSTGASWATSGAGVATLVTNAKVTRNRIHDIVDRGTFSAAAITLNGADGTNTTGNLVANNMIYNVLANGTSPDQTVGIGISAGRGDIVALNSIYLNGDIDPTGATAAAISSFGISVATTTPVNLSVSSNISFMDLNSNTTTLKHGAMFVPASFAWGTGGSNYNDLYYLPANTQSITGRVGTSDRQTLVNWQAAAPGSGQDANSIQMNPQFIPGAELHIQTGSPAIDAGVNIAALTVDFDGEPRTSGVSTDIGADEVIAVATPAIMVSPTSLTDFGNVTVGNSSTSQNYTVSGSNLTANITVTAPTDFEVSLDNSTFLNSVTVTQTGGTASATIYVRFTPQSAGVKSGNVTNASTGATTQNVAVSGTGVAANTPPTISAVGVTRQAGSPGSASTIANVTDAESGNGAVVVTVTSANPSNGVTISSILNNGSGGITANVVAACGATSTSFTLQASDGVLTSTATLNVTVNADSAPTLTYNNASVAFGGSTTVNPATGPSDNGSVSTIAVQSQGTYTTGTISVNNSTGVVSISNAMPAGTHTITIRATDQCGTATDATFTLTVGAAPTVSLSVTSNSASEAGTTMITVTATLSGGTSPTNQTVTLGTSGTATLGSDYTLSGGNLSGTTLTIPMNTTSGSTTFTVIDDLVQESTETAILTISSPSSGITLGSPVSQSISITDNDVAPTFTSGNSTAFSVGTAGSFSVTTSGSPTPTTITSSGALPSGVNFTDNGNGTATLAGTPATGTAGMYPLTFTASNGVSPNATQNFTLTVTAQPAVSLSIAPATGSEAGATMFTATVTASAAVSGSQSVSFALTGGTASSADFGAIPTSITIANGQTTGTATFNVFNDTLGEGTETAMFTISSPSSGIALGSPTTASVTVIDNDDVNAPTISYIPLDNTSLTTNANLLVTITDDVGVPTTGGFEPRVYYLKNAAATYVSNACVYSSGNDYNCTINYASVGGVVNGDSITYFVVAQDTSGNLASNPFGASGGDVNTITTAPFAPNLYNIGTGGSIPSGTYSNLKTAGATLTGDVTVTNNLTLDGVLNTGTSTLTLTYNTSVTIVNNGYVIGNVKRELPVAAFSEDQRGGGPTLFFPVGTANGYSPVSAFVSAYTPGSTLSVFAKQGTQPNLGSATTLKRYWTVVESGAVTANLRFSYNDPLDISGTEANYQMIRVESGNPAFYTPYSITPGSNFADAFNVSDYSDWTLGTSLLAPTAADGIVSGRVTSSITNRGLGDVTVTLSGGSLVEPIVVYTDSLGRYRFTEIPTGEIYTVTVQSKRHRFNQPATAFTLNGNSENINFVGEGW